ncbi:MAG TPA: NAD(P)H-dependent glycerol-3-phosphate dehydrogenase [Nitrospiraceae bacterium]|jgi:glycerol-3-phosphate dehydrogenase (NAD(P)+)|nr:NAD(P)H-dependent glycerol-3-phosphate dehydrogenase [Nitrospiraceae bacterium]
MSEGETVGVIGAGAWGTALARHLAGKGALVRLWAYEPEVVEAIRSKRENTLYLPSVPLPPSLSATGSLEDAVRDSQWLLFAVPSHAARSVLRQLAPLLPGAVPMVSATKGIEEDTLKVMTQVMQEILPSGMAGSLAVLSGPSFAGEVCRDRPTAVSLAGEDAQLVRGLQGKLMTPLFRVYAGTDLVGVQLGGALKNVIALAAGVVDGLELGHNTRAALITRGLAEMIRLGTAMGANPRTFYGLSGMGDLVLTCTGALSRNHTVGVRLGKGEKLDAVLKDMRGIAEGVRTSRAALGLALRHRVEMPIVQEVCAVLFEGKSCRRAVSDLMERSAKEETEL